jgi:hypothetical protein
MTVKTLAKLEVNSTDHLAIKYPLGVVQAKAEL